MASTNTDEKQPPTFPWWILLIVLGGFVVYGVMYQSMMK